MMNVKALALAALALTATPWGSPANAEVKLEGKYIFSVMRRCPINLVLHKNGDGLVTNLSSSPTNDMTESIGSLQFTLITSTSGRARGHLREIRGSSHSIAGSGNPSEPLAASLQAVVLRYRTTDGAVFIEGNRFDAYYGSIDPTTRVASHAIFQRIVDGCIEKGTLTKSIEPPAP